MARPTRKIKILIGVPASGKTTWALEFIRKNPDWVRVNKDSFRYMLRNESFCEPKVEELITTILIKSVHAALAKNLNVIIDNTNLRADRLQQYIDEFKYSADIDYQIFDISLKKAIERDKNREHSVGEKVIKDLFKDYESLMSSYNFQPIPKNYHRPYIIPVYDSMLPPAVIFDIDGTIALMGKRGAFDWENVHLDWPSTIVIEQMEYHKSKDRAIILISGREDLSMEQTKEWLRFYEIPYDEIYMRKTDDFRKDRIIKKEIYDNHIKDRYNVLCVYDDRLQVLDMWYNEGIFAFNVNQGNFEF